MRKLLSQINDWIRVDHLIELWRSIWSRAADLRQQAFDIDHELPEDYWWGVG